MQFLKHLHAQTSLKWASCEIGVIHNDEYKEFFYFHALEKMHFMYQCKRWGGKKEGEKSRKHM